MNAEQAASCLAHPKVVTSEELQRRLAGRRGEKVVFTNGCYDILHPGHVDLLARARAQGDLLVLGLNSDASVRRQGKGADRPVNTFAVRAFVLAHLESVDYVVMFEEDTPYNLISAVRPQVLVKGGDWTPDRIVGRDIVEADGGRVLSLPLLEGYSTTALISRIRTALR
ncbi:rfaE bifunctional protein [Oleidesulfovibrio alaskensis G20]|jgi:rfaE bifunctional protein nucleotidyltransferase chain/domain|uniref:D-glycero-beta-D-manno-heptose 1-phosphate adenylyltransferase n=1 Tax=Oleidesulfovibrio alaskensis (strain ATCC BAA-1058 / DSM 17464 / G20) TaxID=207559 RepID=Q30V98_OLEA2|nr:D-glycero-beta-D-manno-heptose 1-phosphate adenylyltransferase [Oleidesulfovibrio alaskensis]ABB40398.1 rfaE bifunctional protein [Oleidesulfovibrio alaskensis G20]MBG0772662.1 D-glycero-beta-D-manno-heptose 1-phosphate adenylyltransferase [Oleidesulfovibrio alaskensis]